MSSIIIISSYYVELTNFNTLDSQVFLESISIQFISFILVYSRINEVVKNICIYPSPYIFYPSTHQFHYTTFFCKTILYQKLTKIQALFIFIFSFCVKTNQVQAWQKGLGRSTCFFSMPLCINKIVRYFQELDQVVLSSLFFVLFYFLSYPNLGLGKVRV